MSWDPCGAVFSALRSCYTTTGRLYEGGPPVVIRWYFAAPDAPVYDLLSCWEPEIYHDQDLPRPDGAGEVPGAARYWYNGANPGVELKETWCGTEDDFRGEGTPPTRPDGSPDFAAMCGCANPPCIGWGIGRSDSVAFQAGLVVALEWEDVTTDPDEELDLVVALEWEEVPE